MLQVHSSISLGEIVIPLWRGSVVKFSLQLTRDVRVVTCKNEEVAYQHVHLSSLGLLSRHKYDLEQFLVVLSNILHHGIDSNGCCAHAYPKETAMLVTARRLRPYMRLDRPDEHAWFSTWPHGWVSCADPGHPSWQPPLATIITCDCSEFTIWFSELPSLVAKISQHFLMLLIADAIISLCRSSSSTSLMLKTAANLGSPTFTITRDRKQRKRRTQERGLEAASMCTTTTTMRWHGTPGQ